jgi:hypothetical protein
MTRTETTNRDGSSSTGPRFSFQGDFGDIIAVSMALDEGELMPALTIRDENGAEILSSTPGAGTGLLVLLPASGSYTIDLPEEEPESLGGFSVVRTEAATLAIGGIVDAPAETRLWQFEGRANEFVTIAMDAQGEGDPLLSLRTETGELLAQNDDFGGTRNSRIQRRLPATGQYFIDAGWYGGTPPAPYRLTLSGVTPGSLVVGDTVSGAEERLWSLNAQSGDIVSIFMEAHDNLGRPLLRLSDQSGNVVLGDEWGDDAEAFLCGITLPEDGPYMLETDFIANPGEYTLHVEGTEPDTLVAGSVVLNAEPEQCLWQFEGRQGQIVNVAMDATEPGSDPSLTLMSERGERIAYNDDYGVEISTRGLSRRCQQMDLSWSSPAGSVRRAAIPSPLSRSSQRGWLSAMC